ncbi:unnamed protein product [Boreogadus saida]
MDVFPILRHDEPGLAVSGSESHLPNTDDASSVHIITYFFSSFAVSPPADPGLTTHTCSVLAEELQESVVFLTHPVLRDGPLARPALVFFRCDSLMWLQVVWQNETKHD